MTVPFGDSHQVTGSRRSRACHPLLRLASTAARRSHQVFGTVDVTRGAEIVAGDEPRRPLVEPAVRDVSPVLATQDERMPARPFV